MQGDTVKSTKAIDAFIKLLRSTISKSDEYISVEEEIENLKTTCILTKSDMAKNQNRVFHT